MSVLAPHVSFTTGVRLGPYDILAPGGESGMGAESKVSRKRHGEA